MQFVCDSVDKPLELWGTESILEYFKGLRDAVCGGVWDQSCFFPLTWQLSVDDACISCYNNMNKQYIDDAIRLLEVLSSEWTCWNCAQYVRADEFEGELSIRINTTVPREQVRTDVLVVETIDSQSVSALRFVMIGYDEQTQEDIGCLLNFDVSHMGAELSPTARYVILLRGYIADAMNNGRVVVSGYESLTNPLDGWIRFVDQVGCGTCWPNRELEGYIPLSTAAVGISEINQRSEWQFNLCMQDTDEIGKVKWSVDLMFYDYLDTYLVTEEFASGIIDEPSWWEERTAWYDDDGAE
jgi:hypothetical protein